MINLMEEQNDHSYKQKPTIKSAKKSEIVQNSQPILPIRPLPGGLPLPLPATFGTRGTGTKSSGIPVKIFFGRPGRPLTL